MLALAVAVVLGWPKNLTVNLGGINAQGLLQYRCWHDPKTGNFVYTTNDCDGSHKTVTLTKDRRELSSYFDTSRFGRKPGNGSFGNVQDRSIPLLTGNGIHIGITPSQLRSKLGKPTKIAVRGNKGEFWCAMYKKVDMKNREEGHVLRNTYIFKNSKLIEISINLDSVPGCGDDSLSDQGWPWTKF